MEKTCCKDGCKDKESSCIEDVKEEYNTLKVKYKLPEFEQLAEEFDVERVAEKETSFLVREIRRAISEKVSAFLHLFETFMNPSSAPVFIFSMIKNLDDGDKEKVKEIYKKLSMIEIKILKLDVSYNIEKEVEFIKDTNKEWQTIKQDSIKILDKLGEGFDISNSSSKRGYLA